MFRKVTWIAGAVCLGFMATVPAWAQVNGAIYTTDSTGTTVNGNIYPSKDAVYLSGGPQNKNGAGLSPAPGFYYFQVTDPSGTTLLSTDDITCRVVWVNSNGRVYGVPGTLGGSSDLTAGGLGNSTCYHLDATANDFNGTTVVQLIPYLNTPNNGGEYKAWMTPVVDYNKCSQQSSHVSFGFCDSDSKTDNFKIKKPDTASVTVCKFNDDGEGLGTAADGIQDGTEPLIPGWPITATGVDSGSPTTTGQDGCVNYTVSSFPNSGKATVILTEGNEDGFTQTAPPPVSGDVTTPCAGATGADACSVTNGVITLIVSPNEIVTAPFFGNTPPPNQLNLIVSKTAAGGNNFNWSITKSVNTHEIDDATGNATFNYTVVVSHDAGTGWNVQGNITIYNPNTSGGVDGTGGVNHVTVSEAPVAPETCNVNGSGSGTVDIGSLAGGATVAVPYTCTFPTNPGSGSNVVSVTWATDPKSLVSG
jgi:hypothetical protein